MYFILPNLLIKPNLFKINKQDNDSRYINTQHKNTLNNKLNERLLDYN